MYKLKTQTQGKNNRVAITRLHLMTGDKSAWCTALYIGDLHSRELKHPLNGLRMRSHLCRQLLNSPYKGVSSKEKGLNLEVWKNFPI